MIAAVVIVGSLFFWRMGNSVASSTQSGQLRVILLAATSNAPNASGLLVVDRDYQHCTLIVEGLPPHDRGYRLWLTVDGKDIDCGVFAVSEDGYADHRVPIPFALENEIIIRIDFEDPQINRVAMVQDVLHGRLKYQVKSIR